MYEDTLCVLCLQLPDHGAFSLYYGREFMQERGAAGMHWSGKALLITMNKIALKLHIGQLAGPCVAA